MAENLPSPRIFLSAGEASGDHYGAQLIAEMRSRRPGAAFFGLGGKEMEASGLDRIVRAEDVAHMGITEVVRHMPRIYGEYRRLVGSIKKRRPDVAILIDFPDVNFRLARELRKLNIPVVYFVSPQLWAWKRKRLRWVQERVSRMMVIFPFEEHFYRSRGVNAAFVGHPLAQLPLPSSTRAEFAAKNQLDPAKNWIALLPGSRRREIHLNLPEMLSAAAMLNAQDSYEFLIPVASTVDESYVRSFLQSTMSGSKRSALKESLIEEKRSPQGLKPNSASIIDGTAEAVPLTSQELPLALSRSCGTQAEAVPLTGQELPLALGRSGGRRAEAVPVTEQELTRTPVKPRFAFVDDAREALHHARASIVASGTATVQAAIIGNPFVVVYKVSPLTFTVAKRLIRYPAEIPAQQDIQGNLPIAMVNLIAGRRIVPELIQQNFTAANVAAALRPLLDETPERAQMIADLAQVRRRLIPDSARPPIQQVADAVEAFL